MTLVRTVLVGGWDPKPYCSGLRSEENLRKIETKNAHLFKEFR